MSIIRKITAIFILSAFTLNVLASGLPDFKPIVKEAGKAVVSIATEKEDQKKLVPDELRGQLEQTPLMDVLREIFGTKLEEKLSGELSGIGTGSIVAPDGYIVTNYHVVKDAQKIYVRLNDYREFPAKLVGFDIGTDIALLKINAENLPFVIYADNEEAQVGDWVLAIGSPFGFDNTVTAGIISAKGRSLNSERYVPFLQTDVAINPGNSGGPLFNLKGQMIGVNSQIMTESGGFAGISFAIPVHIVKSVVTQIKGKGGVERGWMGLAFQDITRELAASFGLQEVRGALVSKVIPGSPASKSGIKIGDIIVNFNGAEIVKATDLPPLVGVLPVNTKVDLSVLRDHKIAKMSLVVGDVKERLQVSRIQYQGIAMPNSLYENSIKVRDLELSEKKAIDSNEGVMVVTVTSQSWIDAGFRRGDVILSVNQEFIKTPKEFYKLLQNHSGKTIPLLVTRVGEIQRFIAIKVE